MTRLLQRQFDVPVPLADPWRFLARFEGWPQWAAHIRRVDVTPPGDVGPGSSGAIRLRNGIKSTFRMQEFQPGKNWKWVGPVAPDRTRLTWIVDAEGFGASVLGRLFAAVYSRNLDKAIPALIASIGRVT